MKRIRLTGKRQEEFNREVHERDNYTCVVPGCENYVPLEEKYHHEPCGAYKEDVIYKAVCLCYKHHQQRESKDCAAVKTACRDYLRNRYHKQWETMFWA